MRQWASYRRAANFVQFTIYTNGIVSEQIFD
jgi:hypothetical protein